MRNTPLKEPAYRHSEAEEALSSIRRGSRVFIGTGCGKPQLLVNTLMNMAPTLADTEIMHIITAGTAPYTEESFAHCFRHNAFFIGANTRKAIWEGRADYTPIFLSEIPMMFKTGRIHVDTALISVSPPDKYGYVSLGVSVDVTKSAAECADYVVAEVNPNMPRTLGDSFLHVSQIDAFVYNTDPLPEFHMKDPGLVAQKIGKYVSELIEDGSTIQLGYGTIPSAVMKYLKDKKDLGIHTEVFTDSLIDLIKQGVITCRKKNLHPGKIIASFCMGTKRLYRFIDKNPLFEFHPTEYVNDPFTIARNNRMVSINTALSIDLTGQVCSDSLGSLLYSGIGGQLDFVRGAARSAGGKSIIAMQSTAEGGTKSRIVPFLDEGSGVVLTRGDVHYVVTEHGIAHLHGKSIRERAMELINVAHPLFREDLLKTAKKKFYVYQDQLLPRAVVYPKHYETYWVNKAGREVFFRPVKPTDEKKVQELIYALSDPDFYTRFLQKIKIFPHEAAQKFVNVDYKNSMTFVGVLGKNKPGDNEEIIALGELYRDPSSNFSEIGFTVRSDMHRLGIGGFLLWYMIRYAREQGIAGFRALVLKENDGMMKLFRQCGYPINTTLESPGSYEVEIPFETPV